MNADVAVIIPTLRRPESLERAVRSVLAQTGVSDRLREIVVVDNDPQASSRDTTAQLAEEAGIPIIWRHAPRPGVATARNAGLVGGPIAALGQECAEFRFQVAQRLPGEDDTLLPHLVKGDIGFRLPVRSGGNGRLSVEGPGNLADARR